VQARLGNAEQTITVLNDEHSDAAAAHSAELDQLQREISTLQMERSVLQQELQDVQVLQVPERQAKLEQLSNENLARAEADQQQASQQQLAQQQKITADMQVQLSDAEQSNTALNS
jgi:hypothetical protein